MLPSYPKAVIFGCRGTKLLPFEAELFQRHQPLGFILFQRNCKNKSQLKQLISDLQSTVNHTFVPILIDQEGGRVVRLFPPEWKKAWPASFFGRIAEKNLELGLQSAFWQAKLIGQELAELEINVNCAPCADLLFPDADPIIGDRAFSKDINLVHHLTMHVIKGLKNRGIISVIKHLPGHGRAPMDSHKDLPLLSTPLKELNESDLLVFQKICKDLSQEHIHPWGMTAHVVYQSIDSLLPATHSPQVIHQIIRETIGFKGFLISDCLTMKALKSSYKSRVEKALQAGCDAVLYCKSNLEDMIKIVSATPPLSKDAWERLQQSQLSQPPLLTTNEAEKIEHDLTNVIVKHFD